MSLAEWKEICLVMKNVKVVTNLTTKGLLTNVVMKVINIKNIIYIHIYIK